jgi:hypothetical protein
MKAIALFLIGIFLCASSCYAKDVYVNGYTKKDGTYVSPHHRSSPDNTVTNNYGYEGNVNPYTGATGQNHYRDNPTSQYYQPTVQQSQRQYNNQQSQIYGNQRSSSDSSSGSLFGSSSETQFGSNSRSSFGSDANSNSGSQFGSGSKRSSSGSFNFNSE